MLLPEIRNAVRALIIRDSKVLLLEKSGNPAGLRYALPGGGQETGETLHQAVIRECEEEIGVTVEVGDLLHVGDYFKQRSSDPPTRRHLVEFLFNCSVPEDYQPRSGPHPDKHQTGVCWADPVRLQTLNLFPQDIAEKLVSGDEAYAPVYLGEIG